MTHRDDSGEVQVDFVWGNLPMQPNDDRTDMTIQIQSYQDNGWSTAYKVTSDTLRTADYNVTLNNLDYKVPADSHTIATTGYSNFPAYIPNYAGDEDSGLEVVVPNVVRLSRNAAQNLLGDLNLDYDVFYENPQVQGVVSTGTTIRFYVDNTYSLKAGDQVYPDSVSWSYEGQQTITAVNQDPAWIEIVTAVAPDPAIDEESMGTVWPGDNIFNVVLQQNQEPGTIINEGDIVELVVLGD